MKVAIDAPNHGLGTMSGIVSGTGIEVLEAVELVIESGVPVPPGLS
jgi:hypothetical protein